MPLKPVLILAAVLLGADALAPDPLLPAKFGLLYWHALCGLMSGAAAALYRTPGTRLRAVVEQGFIGMPCGVAVGAAVMAKLGTDDPAAIFWGFSLSCLAGLGGPAVVMSAAARFVNRQQGPQ